MKIYMVVTNDMFELPLCVGGINDIALYLGLSANTVKSNMSKHRHGEAARWHGYYKVVDTGVKDERHN